MKTAVIFDLDGTLLNTLDDLYESVNVILDKYNFPLRTKDEVRCFVGNGVPKLIERAIPDGRNNPEFNSILADFKQYYELNSKNKTFPYDGILELLKKLKETGYKIGVVSNKLHSATNVLCEYYFGNLIDCCMGDDGITPKKPAPDSVLNIIKMLNCKKAIYVGDSDVDICTAKNAGIPCVSVCWGFRSREFLKNCGAVCFAENTEELKKKIKELSAVWVD